MTIKILNYRNNCELNYSLVVIFGQVIKLDCDQRDLFVNCKYLNENRKCSIKDGGKFKFIITLRSGANLVEFAFKQESIKLNLIYRRRKPQRCVKLYYVVCSANRVNDGLINSAFDEGRFQSSRNDNRNTVQNAKKRIGLALQMLQTFVASILPNKNTFDLDLDEHDYPKVELFHSEHRLDEFKQMSQEQIWRSIAVELLKANNSNPNLKYLAFLSFSRYTYDATLTKNPNRIEYDELVKMTDCFIALGGGNLACLSTCSLFSWPENLVEIEDKFIDTTAINTKLESNDCSKSSTYGCVYSTSLGSVLHELGHIFDLGHETYGIMDREFEQIKSYFLNTANEFEIKWFNRSSFLILTNHKFLNKNLKYSNEDNWLNVESISLMNDTSNDDRLENKSRSFSFDRNKASLKSKNGIILIEYRDSRSYTLDYTEFNLAKKVLNLSTDRYFNLYKNKQEVLSIIVLDRVGNLFKFN